MCGSSPCQVLCVLSFIILSLDDIIPIWRDWEVWIAERWSDSSRASMWMMHHIPKPFLKRTLDLVAKSRGPCQLVVREEQKEAVFILRWKGHPSSTFWVTDSSSLWILVLRPCGLHAERLPYPSSFLGHCLWYVSTWGLPVSSCLKCLLCYITGHWKRSCPSMEFLFNTDELLQELNSCLHQLTYGEIGFVIWYLNLQNLLKTVTTYCFQAATRLFRHSHSLSASTNQCLKYGTQFSPTPPPF